MVPGFSPPHVGCTVPIGLESGKIPDGSIRTSSSWDAYHGPERSRLRVVKQGSFRGAWSSKYNDLEQWIQVDLGNVSSLEKICLDKFLIKCMFNPNGC